MPELPEAETLCRQLNEVVTDLKILKIQILDSKLGQIENLAGMKIQFIYREGKGLNLQLDDGRTLMIHLRMTGRLLWQATPSGPLPHTRFMIRFQEGRLDLIDPRRFATVKVQKAATRRPREEDRRRYLSPQDLWETGRTRKMPVKSFLLDQRFISGLGNIYACEILHAVSIHPNCKTEDLSLADWQRIAAAAQTILNKAIACRGTTVSDWRDLFGQAGEYQHHLKVYSKEGEPCQRCGTAIERFKLAGRGTYFCPTCQKR